jgi:hypothetical protein
MQRKRLSNLGIATLRERRIIALCHDRRRTERRGKLTQNLDRRTATDHQSGSSPTKLAVQCREPISQELHAPFRRCVIPALEDVWIKHKDRDN